MGFEDDDDLIRLSAPEVGLDKFVATTLWRLGDRGMPSVLKNRPPAQAVGTGNEERVRFAPGSFLFQGGYGLPLRLP
jgi:hypothetical protein